MALSQTVHSLTDIVAERFEAAVQSSEIVARDMISVRIEPDMRFAAVGAPAYFVKATAP